MSTANERLKLKIAFLPRQERRRWPTEKGALRAELRRGTVMGAQLEEGIRGRTAFSVRPSPPIPLFRWAPQGDRRRPATRKVAAPATGAGSGRTGRQLEPERRR